jgi:CMP-N,N'-diacetyllegionaminic acid synthase
MKFITVIPARKGSKSIKNKNRIKINNKPLIQFTFDQIRKSKLSLRNSYVITDDTKVKKIAKKYNINNEYLRPKSLSSGKTPLIKNLLHFVDWTDSRKIKYDYIVILQPTSPLRSIIDINKSIEIINKKKSKCLLSISKSLEHPYESVFINKKNKIDFFLKNGLKYTRRQDFDRSSYFINGAIYITTKEMIKKNKIIDYSMSDFIVMNKVNSLDLNDYSELNLIKNLLS